VRHSRQKFSLSVRSLRINSNFEIAHHEVPHARLAFHGKGNGIGAASEGLRMQRKEKQYGSIDRRYDPVMW
jgi:hypothetical protein